MKRLFFVFFACASLLWGQKALQPDYSLKADGLVKTLLYEKGTLYAATQNGVVQAYDLQNKKSTTLFRLPEIESFTHEMVPSKIYSLDKIGEKLLVTAQGKGSYRNIWLYEADNLKKIIDTSKGYMLSEAKFLDENTILMATLSNQLIKYDYKTHKELAKKQLSYSSFSDFALDKEKKVAAATDESGVVHMLRMRDFEVIKEYEGQNVDRIYDVSYKNGVVMGAGQDRRLSIYKPFGAATYMQFDFLLYACGMNAAATLGAVAYNPANDVLVFEINSKDRLYDLKGNEAVVTKILFVSDSEVFVASESETINHYTLQ
ncbi:MAG: hypothetical protein ACQERK_01550 [Campylobacterota bacterium]